MATNDFKPFATGAGANVTAQAEWASLPALFTGFQSGKASSAQVNKAIRQASFISAALAQYVANKSGQDVLDDGDLAGFIAKLVSGLGKDFQPADATLTNLSGKSVSGLLAYLGLGEGSALPVGVPIPWPLATPPSSWLKCNGAVFDKEKYPMLASAYPSGSLPDLRGEFIRGWDDGRGIDAGRPLFSSQLDALQKMTGAASNGAVTGFVNSSTSNVSGVFKRGSLVYPNTSGQNADYQGVDLIFDSSLVARSATETRPRNITFNYIVRAA